MWLSVALCGSSQVENKQERCIRKRPEEELAPLPRWYFFFLTTSRKGKWLSGCWTHTGVLSRVAQGQASKFTVRCCQCGRYPGPPGWCSGLDGCEWQEGLGSLGCLGTHHWVCCLKLVLSGNLEVLSPHPFFFPLPLCSPLTFEM